MLQRFNGVEISILSSCVPKNKVGNEVFENLMSSKERRIFEKTVGILNRRYADENVTASDLGFEAANAIFQNTDIKREEIDGIIFLSQTSDYKIPFTSNILQDKLNLRSDVLCLDINAGCAGFIQGLGTAFSIAKTIQNGKILFIIAETLSKILSPQDRSTTTLFGDAASACIIHNSGINNNVFFNYHSDGKNSNAIIIPDGGYRNPIDKDSFEFYFDEKGNGKNKTHLSMDGTKVFDFTLREISPSILELLKKCYVNIDDIDYFLLHQSNRFIITQIASQLGIDIDKFLINIHDFGNTSGVSIPLLMTTDSDNIKDKTLLLSGYGSGLNWGNAIIHIENIIILPLQEL